MAHPFNPSTRQRQVDLCEFKASLVFRVSSSTARTTHRNPVSKIQKEKRSDEACPSGGHSNVQIDTTTVVKDFVSLAEN